MNIAAKNSVGRQHIIEAIMERIELPSSAYEKAELRYEDIGDWMNQPNRSDLAKYHPHVASQGSFRLGTANKPINDDEYDLDLTVKLQRNLTHASITQEHLKLMLHRDLESYRRFRSIQDPVESKRRCCRLNYQDNMSFHMDIVPSIPANKLTVDSVERMLIESSSPAHLARSVSKHAVSITDNQRFPQYNIITDDWLLSNPEGYALWFEEQSKKAIILFDSKVLYEGQMASVSELPNFRWKSPLQQCVQVLKHHRDIMYAVKNIDSKPISVIITTLAARAYDGETNLALALKNILSKMELYINDVEPRVPNPVNLNEDFADKWSTQEGVDLELEYNFRNWLKCAQEDFKLLDSTFDSKTLNEHVRTKLGVRVSSQTTDNQIVNNNLLSKATAVTSGLSSTSALGVIGDSGVKNKEHEFYGDELD